MSTTLSDRQRLAAAEARQARGEIEAALEARGWPWSARLSGWIDALITIEECPADDEMTS